MKLKDPISDRRHGIMFGLAYGDALGRPTEFMTAANLAKLGDPFRPRVGLNKPQQGIVTDDTQMSIAVAKAAVDTAKPVPAVMSELFIAEFIRWQRDPKSLDGRRAPGGTCMGAVSALQRNQTQWLLATRPDSKGNGANMRVSPLALRTDWTWDELAGAAQLQAAITHGHPTALAAAELTAVAVRMLLERVAEPTEQLIDHLLAHAYDQRDRYRGDWLGHLWQAEMLRPALVEPAMTIRKNAMTIRKNWWDDAAGTKSMPVPYLAETELSPWAMNAMTIRKNWWDDAAASSPQEYIRRGWDEMIDALNSIYRMPRDKQRDPCDVAGGGWVAEQALAASLHTLLCFPDDPTNALRRAAFTDGDSDSIASITGALAGAAYGLKAFPSHWIGNLEYRHELESLTGQLTAASRR